MAWYPSITSHSSRRFCLRQQDASLRESCSANLTFDSRPSRCSRSDIAISTLSKRSSMVDPFNYVPAHGDYFHLAQTINRNLKSNFNAFAHNGSPLIRAAPHKKAIEYSAVSIQVEVTF